MSEFSNNSELLTNYLLGNLSPTELDRFEEEYFCNNEVFIALLDAKDQLISDYLNGKLTYNERQRFERHFLSLPDRKREVEIASFLQRSPGQAVNEHSAFERKSSWWQPILSFIEAHQPQIRIAAAAILIIGAVWIWRIMQNPPSPSQTGVISSSEQTPAGEIIVSLPLKPRSVRSSRQETTAKVGTATQTIELKLEVGTEPFRSYAASLFNKDKDDVEILSNKLLKAVKNEVGKPIVNWQLPAARLPVGDYTVKLSGIADDVSTSSHIGDYDFEVRHQQAENFQQSK